MMYFIYSFLYTVAIIFLFFPQYMKRAGDLRRRWLREKFGYLPVMKSSIWVHAVSVGEVGATLPLVRRLKAEYPACPIILSTITDTGQRVAVQKMPERTEVVYLPFDVRFILRRGLRRVNPKILISIETELWPNLYRTFSKEGVPVVVLNGRISERSCRGYRKISFFMRRVFAHVALFGMQSAPDAERIRQIGAAPEKVAVLGNFKFDMDLPLKTPAWAEGITGPVIVAGSTFEGEEELILSAFMVNREKFPDLKLIIAPRHPERFREVADLIRSKKIPFVRRSKVVNGNSKLETHDFGVMLLDSLGELSAVYGIGEIAIVGKSFYGFGGQNPLEPAYWGKAIICGPHMENFPFMDEFYREGAAFEVEPTALAKKMRELLISPDRAGAAGQKAKELFAINSGAVERAIERIRGYLDAPH